MTEIDQFKGLFDNPALRRWWLLYKALECKPLDRAIELARTADDFITDSASNHLNATARPDAIVASSALETEQELAAAAGAISTEKKGPTGRREAKAGLPTELRHQLIDRLAAGAQNTELAAEFNLAPKQVQGVRIGCAREIAQRRSPPDEAKQSASRPPVTSASADEVVRYLRQQDDVVVRQTDGTFLVNGRFQLQFSELVSRANRMRSRQGKPNFELTGHLTKEVDGSANGHPLFWTPTEPNASDGLGTPSSSFKL